MTVTAARTTTRVATRMTVRLVFLCALGFLALLFLAGRAHALSDPPPDAQPPTSDSAPASTPPAESPAPPTLPVAQPTSPTPAGAGGPDNADDPGTPATTPATTSGTTSGTTSAPTNSSTQDSTVGTSGTSTANTGGNTSVATSGAADESDPSSLSSPPSSTTPTSGATATTGSAAATGDKSTSKIDQQVNASASDDATVEILQIALVVNVGIAQSTSGDNAAGSAAGGPPAVVGSTAATDRTGNALATGDNAHTGIVQGANVGNGESSSQTSTVLNIGIAVSNTGINVTIASVGGGTAASSAPTAPTSATVSTGNAAATGDRATSTIGQSATANASGSALVTIDQRAIVVNFGIAISNTGGNFALASFDPSELTPEEQVIINALLGSLAPIIFGAQLTMPGSSMALAATGNANGVGNSAVTTISQTATGTATGSSSASASQVAQVGNLGLALANTGFNGAFAGTPASESTPATVSSASLTQTEAALGAFFALITNPDWLASSNPFAAFAQTVQINGVTIDLGGSLSATDLFAGLDNVAAPTDAGPGVHVVQISGVLDIGIATSDSGDNTVISTVAGSTTADGPSFSTHLATTNATPTVGIAVSGAKAALPVAGAQTVRARIVTGNATSVGNFAVISVCQAFHDSVCTPPPPPSVPPPPAVTPDPTPVPVAPPAVVETATPVPGPAAATPTAEPVDGDGKLPFTGADTSTFALLGGSLLALGMALCRRRKSVAGGRRPFVSGD